MNTSLSLLTTAMWQLKWYDYQKLARCSDANKDKSTVCVVHMFKGVLLSEVQLSH